MTRRESEVGVSGGGWYGCSSLVPGRPFAHEQAADTQGGGVAQASGLSEVQLVAQGLLDLA